MNNETDSRNDRVAQEHWSREANEEIRYGKGFHWVESPLVLAYLNEQTTGNPHEDWLAYSCHKYLEGATSSTKRVLSLGCGGGVLERHLHHLGFLGQIEACDFSEGAVEHAREMAARENIDAIRYFTCDLNQAQLPRATYDVVYAGSCLHHISNLEHLLDQVRNALVDGGLLITNEYVGPFKLQWTQQQTKLIDEILHLLPPKYRRRVTAPDQSKDGFPGPASIAEMDAIDPTESVRSDEIVPLIRERFSVIEQRDYGGTLLHMLLQDIVGNFDAADPSDAGFLNLLIYIEKLLIREKVLGSDFVFLVAQKSSGIPVESGRGRRLNHGSRAMGDTGQQTPVNESSDSAAWQMLLRFRKWKERRLPIGSHRRRVYDNLLARVQARLTKRS